MPEWEQEAEHAPVRASSKKWTRTRGTSWPRRVLLAPTPLSLLSQPRQRLVPNKRSPGHISTKPSSMVRRVWCYYHRLIIFSSDRVLDPTPSSRSCTASESPRGLFAKQIIRRGAESVILFGGFVALLRF